jgi:hypothetical protein
MGLQNTKSSGGFVVSLRSLDGGRTIIYDGVIQFDEVFGDKEEMETARLVT